MILANRLVRNPDHLAGLELLLRGPVLRFPEGGEIALTGADMQARCNGVSLPRGRTLSVPRGAQLELGQAVHGLRGYMAVAGGIETEPVLGSRATFLPGAFGGWQGRPLGAGDKLPVGKTASGQEGMLRWPDGHGAIRILPGPQLAGFANSALKAMTAAGFGLSADSNRLGLRLTGPALQYAGSELASQAVLPGAIQVTPSGQAIILGWDGPVTGGYPVIAAVIAADLPRLSQLRPGDSLRFAFVALEEAQAAWRQRQERMNGAILWGA
jgi:biotin-dependent carboxylase-like uncharacterized protein